VLIQIFAKEVKFSKQIFGHGRTPTNFIGIVQGTTEENVEFRTGDFVLGSAQISHDQGSILTMSSRDIHVLPPIFRGNTFPLLDIARLKSAQMMMEQEVDRCGVEVHFEHNYSYSLSTHFRNFYLMNSRIKTGKRGSSNQTSIERKVNSCILTLQDAELFSRSELLVRKWILTGGSGGLGCITSRWITAQNCNIYLISFNRTGRGKLRDLLFSNSVITWNSAYSTPRFHDRNGPSIDQFQDFSAKVSVMHMSGVIHDALALFLTKSNISHVFSPKVYVADRVLESKVPSMLNILFSSLAVAGSVGQSNYAAANASLDLRSMMYGDRGIPVLSIRWGLWSGVGMVVNASNTNNALTPVEGLACLETITVFFFSYRYHNHVMTAANMGAFDSIEHDGVNGINLVDIGHHNYSPKSEHHCKLISQECHKKNNNLDLCATRILVRRILTEILCKSTTTIRDSEPFISLGLDSFSMIEFSNRLRSIFFINIPDTIAYDYPSVDALVHHLFECMHPHQLTAKNVNILEAQPILDKNNGRMHMKHFKCFDIPQYGLDLVRSLEINNKYPWNRCDIDGKEIFSAFISRVIKFGISDSIVYSISKEESCKIDPQHLLLLTKTCKIIAGLCDEERRDIHTGGVFVGIS
jgi:acyl carrier protein